MEQQATKSTTTASRVLTSLAILKTNWDVLGNDYIQNFVTFVAEVLRESSVDSLSLHDVQAGVLGKFGLRIPQGALRTVLQRCAKRGYVRRRENQYDRDPERLRQLTFMGDRQTALRTHEELASKLVTFAKERYQRSISKEDADIWLLSHIEELCPAILAAAVEGSPVPDGHPKGAEELFIVNSFVQHLYWNDSAGFALIETLVKGVMLTNVLLLPEMGQVERRFDKLAVYLDTPVVLSALGLEGTVRQEPVVELLELLYGQNANLFIFEHTFDEICGVLDAAARRLRGKGNTKSAVNAEYFEFLSDRPYSASDIELIIARLKDSLQRLRIRIRPRPEQTAPLGLDETRLQQIIGDYIAYQHDRAKQYDVDSLTSVHRLRGGKRFNDIESCRALFITNNQNLVTAASDFFREHYEQTTVPLCMNDYVMATLVWLKNPLRSPDLPRKRVMADCYAALKPSERLWRMYLAEIEKLKSRRGIDENDYTMLRYSIEARRALMDVTLGKAEGVSETTVTEVLAVAKQAIKADVESRANAIRQELSAEKVARKEAETQMLQRAQEVAALHLRQRESFQNFASRCGFWVGRIVLFAFTPLLCLGTYFASSTSQNLLPWLAPYTPWLVGFVAVFGIAGAAFGTSLQSVSRGIEMWISRRLFELMCAKFANDAVSIRADVGISS